MPEASKIRSRGGGGKEEDLTDMAVQKPHSWIIGSERNGQITSKRQKRHVPSRGIVEVEGTDAGVDIIRGRALSKNDKVVAVKMHGVSGWSVKLDREIRKVLTGDDEVDITLSVVLRNNCIVWIEGDVVEIQNCRV